jgi:hypothetical protein
LTLIEAIIACHLLGGYESNLKPRPKTRTLEVVLSQQLQLLICAGHQPELENAAYVVLLPCPALRPTAAASAPARVTAKHRL